MFTRYLTVKSFDWSSVSNKRALQRTIFNKPGSDKGSNRLSELRVIVQANKQHTGKMECSENVMKFTDYDCIGFDLDNTLSRYQISNMVKLEYKILSNYLVVEKGYPSTHLFKPLEDDVDFMIRGLMLDVENRNILRLAADGSIMNVAHGTRMLSHDEIIQTYGDKRRWDATDLFFDNPLNTWNGPYSMKLRALLDYFDMPASLAFARAVDTLNDADGHKLDKYQIWPDILSALQEMFERNNYPIDKGGFFPTVKANPENYYHKCSSELIDWLKTLRKSNKILFLITGSNVDFASLTAKHTLGANWRDLFDIVVCYAKKPGFFTEQRPFIGLNGFDEIGKIDNNNLLTGGIYNNGNWMGLYNFLKQKTGKLNPKVVYLGDNLVQDIYTPAVYTTCDTVSICEELEAEGVYGFDGLHKDKAILMSKTWGSYFNGPDENSPTLWLNMIKKFSKICIPSVEYIAKKSIDYEYTIM